MDIIIEFLAVDTEDGTIEPEISLSVGEDHIVTINPPCEMQEFTDEPQSWGDVAEEQGDRLEYVHEILSEHGYDIEVLVKFALIAIQDGNSDMVQNAIEVIRGARKEVKS